MTNNWRKNGRGSRRIEEERWYGEARGRSDNNLPSFEVRVSISVRKTCPLPVNYSQLLAGKRGGEGGQPAGPTELFLDSSFTAKRRGTKGEKLRLCALYTRIHIHLYTHPFRVRERLSYRPGRVRVHANVWQVHSFHPRDPIPLRGKGEKERKGEREREPFRGRNSMQIRERDRSEAFDESFVGYSNGVVVCAGRVHARREGVKWVEGVGRLSDESFRSRLFSFFFSIHGPLPFY